MIRGRSIAFSEAKRFQFFSQCRKWLLAYKRPFRYTYRPDRRGD